MMTAFFVLIGLIVLFIIGLILDYQMGIVTTTIGVITDFNEETSTTTTMNVALYTATGVPINTTTSTTYVNIKLKDVYGLFHQFEIDEDDIDFELKNGMTIGVICNRGRFTGDVSVTDIWSIE